MTSGNSNDQAYAPETGSSDSSYELSEKKANEEIEYDKVMQKVADKINKDKKPAEDEMSNDPFHFMPDA